MNDSTPPPYLGDPLPPEMAPPAPPHPDASAPRSLPAWRWWIHLIVLGSYPVVLGLLSAGLGQSEEKTPPPLRPELGAILATTADALLSFGVFFLAAWAASRVTTRQMLLRHNPWKATLAWGLVLSVALRVMVMAAVLAVYLGSLAVGGIDPNAADLRPRTDLMVDIQGQADHPLFFLTNLTLISFVVAGLREELWRAGVLAATAVLFPKWHATWRGKLLVVTGIAVLFGIGHLPAGWSAVVLTTVLGLGLGVIILWRQSIWEAVLAHGFFDATTFALLYVIAKFFPGIMERITS